MENLSKQRDIRSKNDGVAKLLHQTQSPKHYS